MMMIVIIPLSYIYLCVPPSNSYHYYSATRPPPLGASTERLEVTKPRSEILRDCRVKCAKSKDQLLMGKPKVIKTPQTEAPKQE